MYLCKGKTLGHNPIRKRKWYSLVELPGEHARWCLSRCSCETVEPPELPRMKELCEILKPLELPKMKEREKERKGNKRWDRESTWVCQRWKNHVRFWIHLSCQEVGYGEDQWNNWESWHKSEISDVKRWWTSVVWYHHRYCIYGIS